MKKLAIALLCISTTGCGLFHKPQPAPVIRYQINTYPLDLSQYKGLDTTITNEGKICYAYDDYTKTIELLNVLKDYIRYQQKVITEMDNYYNPKK